MTAPTSPYCTSAQVGSLNINILNGKLDFDDFTTPNKTRVDTLIALISSHIDSNMAAAGYYVPFESISGETWPDYQTTYLALVCSVGVAAKAFSEQLAPAPSLSRAGGKLGNLFDEQFNLEMRKIYDYQTDASRLRFRARFRLNSPAERVMRPPVGPMLDFDQGYFDPSTSWSFQDYTELASRIQCAFRELNVPWDYANSLLNMGLGYTPQESELWLNNNYDAC